MMRSNSTKPLYWLQALRRGLPIWRNQRSGSRPVNAHAQYVFQAEGSLKTAKKTCCPNMRCCAGNRVSDRRGEMRPV